MNRHDKRKELCEKLRKAEEKAVEALLQVDVASAAFDDWLKTLERIIRVRKTLCSW